MIARLRRHRWLAALLVVASPAVSGQVLPVLHPCPVDAPWMAAAHHAAMADMPGMAGDATAPADQAPAHHDCTCLGHSSAPAIVTPPQGIVVAASVEAPRFVRWPVIEAVGYRASLVDRLPETTAPPQA